MKSEDIKLKFDALHLRLLDNHKQYELMLDLILKYVNDNHQMGEDVNAALEDGLKNHQQMANIENALSPRHIRIVKREMSQGQVIRDTETEGLYQVVLGFDDGYEQAVHFNKKQDQILYILMVFCSMKNGLYADFFKKEEDLVVNTVRQLIDIIYPNAQNNGDKANIIMNLRPSTYFTDIVQKIKAPIESCVVGHGDDDELMWFLPYTLNFGLKRIYQMRILPTNIIYPPEFQPIVDALPNASKYVDMSSKMPDKLKGLEHVDQSQLHDALLSKAKMGDVEAMNAIAFNYNYGTGVMEDQEKAFSWWKKAADLGNAEAQYYVALMYADGDIVDQDYRIATEYLRKSAAQDYVDAIYMLGVFKRSHFGCKGHPSKAAFYFEKAASKGNIDAAFCLAMMLYNGEGIRRNYEKAVKIYLELAEKDFEEAIWYVVDAYLKGNGIEKNEQEAWKWIERGIEKELTNVYYLAGLYLYNKKSYDNASVMLKKAAEFGSPCHGILALMSKKKLGLMDGTKTETLRLLIHGAKNDERDCCEMMQDMFPEEWETLTDQRKPDSYCKFILNMIMAGMGSDDLRTQFLKHVDSYKEVYRERYQEEINKQLSIHLPSSEKEGSSEKGKRRILIRKSSRGYFGYELVLKLINGEEIVISKMNPNSMMLILLAIVCSFKSGYTTMMADEKYVASFKPYLATLTQLVLGKRSDAEINFFIENVLAHNRNYRTYSNIAKNEIKKSIGMKDDVVHYLFDNFQYKDTGRANFRRMLIDVRDIILPSEFLRLAEQMPDARNMLQEMTYL